MISNRSLFRRFATALIICTTFALLTTQRALAEDASATVLVASGSVVAEHGGEQRPLKSKSLLYSGDIIITGTGQLQLRFKDGTLLTLYPKTRFAIDDYRYGDKNKPDRAHFSLIQGLMHTLTGQIDKRNYRVRTRLADLGVRGTDYSADLGQNLMVNVRHGAVMISNAAGSLLVKAGNSAQVGAANAMPQLMAKKVGNGGGPGGAGRRPAASGPAGANGPQSGDVTGAGPVGAAPGAAPPASAAPPNTRLLRQRLLPPTSGSQTPGTEDQQTPPNQPPPGTLPPGTLPPPQQPPGSQQ